MQLDLFQNDDGIFVGQGLNIYGDNSDTVSLWCKVEAFDPVGNVIDFYVENGCWRGKLHMLSKYMQIGHNETNVRPINRFEFYTKNTGDIEYD